MQLWWIVMARQCRSEHTTYQPFGQMSSPSTVIVQDLRLPVQESDPFVASSAILEMRASGYFSG